MLGNRRIEKIDQLHTTRVHHDDFVCSVRVHHSRKMSWTRSQVKDDVEFAFDVLPEHVGQETTR